MRPIFFAQKTISLQTSSVYLPQSGASQACEKKAQYLHLDIQKGT